MAKIRASLSHHGEELRWLEFLLEKKWFGTLTLIAPIRIFQCFFLKVVLGMERRLVATTVRHMDHAHERQSIGRSWHGRFTPGPEAQLAQLYPACFALDSFRRKTWSDDPGNKMAFLPHPRQPRHLEKGELQRIYMRAMRQGGHLGIKPPSRRATRHHHFELEKATAT